MRCFFFPSSCFLTGKLVLKSANWNPFRKVKMTDDLKIFSGGSNPDLATEICGNIGIPLSPMETSRFSNDNLFVQIKESVREKMYLWFSL